MFFSPFMRLAFKIFMSALSLIILFSFQTPKNILLTPLIEQIYNLYEEEELKRGIVDRIVNKKHVVILLENELEEVVIDQLTNKQLKSGDVVNLIEVDQTYKFVNVNESETIELKQDMQKLINELNQANN